MMFARMLRLRFMRDHVWTRRHLSEYLDGDLDGAGRARVERHVHICPRCHGLLETLRKTLQGLQALGRQPLPAEGVADSVIGRLREEP